MNETTAPDVLYDNIMSIMQKIESNMYLIGKNKYGEFGLNHVNSLSALTQHYFVQQKIKNIKCGYGYAIYIDENGDYFSSGYNEYGQCCIGNFDKSIPTLTKIDRFKKLKITIKKICTSISGCTTFFISNFNKLWGCGYNHVYQLGVGSKDDQCYPVLIKRLVHHNVIDAKSAWQYSIVLCNTDITNVLKYWYRIHFITKLDDMVEVIKLFYGNSSCVFSTSYSKFGGNGHGDSVDAWKARWHQIRALKDTQIIKIATGLQHSLFLESNGVLWSCGFNVHGELGLGNVNDISIPDRIQFFIDNKIKIKEIACGWYHNLAIDYNGKMYSWGYNKCGQCGDGTTNTIYLPKELQLDIDYQVIRIACGGHHSYCTAVDADQKIYHYFFGYNRYGQCIEENEKYVLLPYSINKMIKKQCNDKEIKHVACGFESTTFIVA